MGFLNFGVKDLLDVLLVWIITYEVLKLFRGTRAVYMVFGLVIIILFAILAQFFNFEGLNWIIRTLKTIGLVALVIVFQPEIRRALVTLGRHPAVRSIIRQEEEPIIPEIVKAAFTLRDRGMGGLIVIERKIGLREYVEESGVPLDAKVSALLIVSIFTPPSPLHDGAVIISGNKIIAARVILPLSNSPLISPSLGTRHRAAVGVTEVSDAIAIVTSEERMSVRHAVNGELSPPHTKESLSKALQELLYPEIKVKEA